MAKAQSLRIGVLASGAGTTLQAVVDAIGKVQTGPMDRPTQPVVIESVTVEER